MPAEFISGEQAESLRRLLLEKGAVSDLFDCGKYWYIGWLGSDEDPFAKTQVLRVPPRDEWQPQFVVDLGESLLLWRWGDLVPLPRSGPWTWAHLPHDYVSRLKRLGAQLEAVDTATLSDVAAFLRISYIETGLRYLLHLRVGDKPGALWQLLETTSGEQVRSRWKSSKRGEPHDFLDLRHFQEILKAGWSNFVNLFQVEGHGDGDLLLSELRRGIHQVNEVRKVVMHPTQMSQRVNDEDLQALDALIEPLDAAIARAEDDDRVGDGLPE